MTERPGNQRRRVILGVLGAGAGLWAFHRWLDRPRALTFEPVPGAPGFRMVQSGSVSSGGFDPFIGLDDAPPRAKISPEALCETLFHRTRPGTVPVASFSDYNCPYCRVLTPELARREAAGDITVTWHELPLLGPESEAAARLALAADMQGGYVSVHTSLMRSRVVATAKFAEALANRTGLDPDRLRANLASPAIDRRLAEAHGLADIFGFFGTPALVIGRTAILGEIAPGQLDALIAQEPAGALACP